MKAQRKTTIEEAEAMQERCTEVCERNDRMAQYLFGLADGLALSGTEAGKKAAHHLSYHADECASVSLWIKHQYRD